MQSFVTVLYRDTYAIEGGGKIFLYGLTEVEALRFCIIYNNSGNNCDKDLPTHVGLTSKKAGPVGRPLVLEPHKAFIKDYWSTNESPSISDLDRKLKKQGAVYTNAGAAIANMLHRLGFAPPQKVSAKPRSQMQSSHISNGDLERRRA